MHTGTAHAVRLAVSRKDSTLVSHLHTSPTQAYRHSANPGHTQNGWLGMTSHSSQHLHVIYTGLHRPTDKMQGCNAHKKAACLHVEFLTHHIFARHQLRHTDRTHEFKVNRNAGHDKRQVIYRQNFPLIMYSHIIYAGIQDGKAPTERSCPDWNLHS